LHKTIIKYLIIA